MLRRRARPDGAKGHRASFTEGLSFGVISFASVLAIGLVGSIIVARVYGIETLGLAALALAPGTALELLSSIREQAALVRELSTLSPRDPRVTGLWVAVFCFSFVLTLVVAAITVVGTIYVFEGPLEHPELVAPALVNIAGYVLLANTTWNMDMILSSFRAGRQLYWVRLSQAIAFLVLAVAWGLASPTVWGIIFATIGSIFISLLLRLVWFGHFMRYRVPRAEIRDGFRTLPRLIKFGLKLAPGRFSDGISTQSGTWILGAVSTVAAVGAWNRAFQLAIRLYTGSNRITEMLLPTLVERRARGDADGHDRALIDSLRYTAIIFGLVAAAGGGGAHAVMGLYGEGFSQAANALVFLLLVPVVASMGAILNTLMLAADRPTVTTVIAFARMAVTVSLGIWFGIWFGVTGTAVATFVGFCVTFVLYLPLMRPLMSASFFFYWPVRHIAVLVLAYATGFVAARLVDDSLSGPLALVAALAAGSVVFLATLVLLRGYTDRDRDRVRSAVGRLRGRSSRATPQVSSS